MIGILSINEMKEGDIITRVYPTEGYEGDRSFIGQKLKLIKLTDTDIIIEVLCDSGGGTYTLSRKEYQYGWVKYCLSGDKEDTIESYLKYKGQLRVQYVYLGIELDKLRYEDPNDKFGDYLTVCRYIEEIGCSC